MHASFINYALQTKVQLVVNVIILIFEPMCEEPVIELIYKDGDLLAINKPCGLLVHKTKIAADADTSVLKILRKQLEQKLYTIHRLDRKTSGVLLFGLDKNIVQLVQKEFMEHRVEKKYMAIVRGFFPEKIEVNHALTNDRNKTQEANTFFQKIKQTELDIPFGKFQTSRYSLIEAFPKTGRQHQIRKHLNHLRHPIIGDRPHGCNKQNKLFKEKWNFTTMLLHAKTLKLIHPISKSPFSLEAPLSAEFLQMKTILQL